MRTEGERMREFVAYVRMLGVQRGAMHSTVEDSADEIRSCCTSQDQPLSSLNTARMPAGLKR